MKIDSKSLDIHVNEGNAKIACYSLEDEDISLATAEIATRYPAKGYALNESVKEVIFVLEGSGQATIDGQSYNLSKNDALLIPVNTPYFIEENLKILMPCTPAWSEKQHRLIAFPE